MSVAERASVSVRNTYRKEWGNEMEWNEFHGAAKIVDGEMSSP